MRRWISLLLTSSLWSQSALLDGFSHAEGLANDAVRCIASDARGFLWFGTGDGLSRSDGRRFTSYGFDSGLLAAQIDAIATSSDGRLALGMHGPWLALYDPTATPVLHSTRLQGDDLGSNVCAICAGNAREWWFATETGLFRTIEGGAAAALRVVEDDRQRWYGTLARSSRGEIAYFNTRETAVVGRDGLERFPRGDARLSGNVWSALECAPGRWLVLEDRRLVELQLHPAQSTPHALSLDADVRFTCLCSDGHDGYWLGTTAGLRKLEVDASGGIHESMRILDGEWIRALELDRAGNLWIAGNTRGLLRRSGLPFTAIGLPDAAESGMPVLLRATPRGLFGVCDRGELVRALDDRMVPVALAPQLRSKVAASRSAIDGVGRLWVAESDSLLVIGTEDTAPGKGRLERRFEIRVDSFAGDSRGRVLGRAVDGAAFVVDPVAGPASEPQILALPREAPRGAVVWCDDERGVWIATALGLVRATASGCEALVDVTGAPITAASVVEDPRGGLWLIDTPRAEIDRVRERHGSRVESHRFDLAGVLPVGALVRAIGDARGHLWIAGASGMIELDPDGGRMRRLQWPYRVVAGHVNSLAIAADGNVWIASGAGVFRFDPSAWRPGPRPTLFVDELSIAGVPVRLPDGGTDNIPDLVVPSSTSAIALHFVAPDLAGDALRIQHRLRPIDTGFSPPEPVGGLRLAGLAGGDYQLEVRATTADSIDVGPQLRITISVLRPFWRTPLFVSIAVLAIALSAFGFHRMRVRRLLALERIRRRIAMDLHDDLGSGLAQVAVLSEAAKRQVEGERVGALDGIAQVARSLRASLGDIVWAVDPARDTVPELVHRLRDLAVTLFPQDSVRMRFRAPADAAVASMRMKPDRRRNLFLLAKEAFTNCARHAHATTVAIEIEVDQRVLRLRVADDGVGFDVPAGGSGRGLSSMEARSAELGGSLRIDSARGRGTVVVLEAPL